MKSFSAPAAKYWLPLGVFILTAIGFLPLPARARTITLSLEVARLQYSVADPNYQGRTFYSVNTFVYSDTAPVTIDLVSNYDGTFVGTETGDSRYFYGDFATDLHELTNGVWTLLVNQGDVSQQTYTFTVSTSAFTNDIFPAIQIIDPPDGDLDVATNTPFDWAGPAAWEEIVLADHSLDYSFYTGSSPSPATNAWSPPPLLPLGTNEFEVTYKTNGTAWFTLSVPVDGDGHPFTNWVGGSKLTVFSQSGFIVSTNVPLSTSAGHELIAQYTFDNSGAPGRDASTNANNLIGVSTWGTYVFPAFSPDAEAGGGAAQFFGSGSLVPQNQVFTAWTNTLAGSFTVSVWLNTTNQAGRDEDPLDDFTGQSVIYGDNNSLGATPVALTGSKVAFLTTDPDGNADTLHSFSSVTTGQYVQVVATRDQITGEKIIYVNGVRDNSNYASSESLTGSGYDSIGGASTSAYTGLLDDVQIYAGVLSSNEVAFLYHHPGMTVPNVTASVPITLGTALNDPDLFWTTSFGTAWFVETPTNHDGVVAVQSAPLTDDTQYATLQTTLTGPGTLSFWWQSAATDGDFDLEFDIDGGYYDNLQNDIPWTQDTFAVAAGPHVLTWSAFAADSTNDTGWVDQFGFTPAPPAVILQPQTMGANFQFSFQTQAGLNHAIEYSTNLTQNVWQTYSTVAGDGTVQTISLPLTVFGGSSQGYVRVTTQ
jgi:hypothetical protein